MTLEQVRAIDTSAAEEWERPQRGAASCREVLRSARAQQAQQGGAGVASAEIGSGQTHRGAGDIGGDGVAVPAGAVHGQAGVREGGLEHVHEGLVGVAGQVTAGAAGALRTAVPAGAVAAVGGGAAGAALAAVATVAALTAVPTVAAAAALAAGRTRGRDRSAVPVRNGVAAVTALAAGCTLGTGTAGAAVAALAASTAITAPDCTQDVTSHTGRDITHRT